MRFEGKTIVEIAQDLNMHEITVQRALQKIIAAF